MNLSAYNCGLVILHYQDFASTQKLLDAVKDFHEIDYIFVVDNNSQNNSYEILKAYENGKIHVIQSDKNGGYSYGNNYGARYLIDNFHPDIIGIANPDVIFSEDLVQKVKESFATKPDYAVITGTGFYVNYDGSMAYSLLWDSTHRKISFLLKAPIMYLFVNPCKRIVKKLLHIKTARKKVSYTEQVIHSPGNFKKVWAVCGCLFFIRTEDFVNIGMFDENIFLYCEEFILASKLEDIGRKTGITKEASFVHNHIHPSTELGRLESSMKESIRTSISNIYYFEHYVTGNKLLQVLYGLLKYLQIAKIYALYNVKKLRYYVRKYFTVSKARR